MEINIYIFILLYLSICCFLPMLVFYFVQNSKTSTSALLNFWSFIVFVTTIFLTLFFVSITSSYISFDFPEGCFFEFNYADGMNLHNMFINFALCIPLGILSFYRFKSNFPLLKPIRLRLIFNPSFIGLVYATFIEAMQGIFPSGRFVDASDILFDSLFTALAFYIAFAFDCIVNQTFARNIKNRKAL